MYAVAGALLKAAGLVLAPLLLNETYLPVEDYGSFALLMVTAQLAVYLAGLGQSTALLRFMTRPDEDVDPKGLPATAFGVSVAASVLVGAFFLVFSEPLAGALAGSTTRSALMGPLAAYVAFRCMGSVPLTLLRVREQAGRYALAVLFEVSALIVMAYLLLARGGQGLEGLLQAYAWSAAIALVLLVALTVKGTSLRLDPRVVKPLLRFGVPLVLASLSGWFLNAGDRYILNWLADRGAVAGYEWSARLAGLINMLFVQAFQLSFTVVGLKALSGTAGEFYRKTFRHFVIWTGGAVLLLSVWTPEGMRVLVDLFDVSPHYLQARTLVFPLALGFGAYGVYVIANNALLASGRTGVIGASIALVALLNAGLNIALIPFLGAMGAAVSTTLSYAVLAGAAVRLGRRDLEVAYPWRIAWWVLGVATLLFLAGLVVDTWDAAARIVMKTLISLGYPVAVAVLGLYTRTELKQLATRVRELAGFRG